MLYEVITDAFAREQMLRIVENTAAMRAAVVPGGFTVETSAGPRSCRFLVLATGSMSEPEYPDLPGLAYNPFV